MKGVSKFENRIQIIIEVFVILAIFVFAQSTPFLVARIFNNEQQGISYIFVLIISVIALVFAFVAWFRSVERHASNLIKKPLSGKTWIYMCGASLGVNYVIGGIWTLLVFLGYNAEPAVSMSSVETNILVLILQTVILAPLIEDIVFRGLILHHLREGFRLNQAIIISSILFGIFHFNTPGGGFKAIYSGVLGILFCVLYLRSGDIKTSIIAHAMFNFIPFYRNAIFIRIYDISFIDSFRGVAGVASVNYPISIMFFIIGMILLGFSLMKLHRILPPWPDLDS